jgi:hypothetical protein
MDIWNGANKVPKDGKWFYVVVAVECLDCRTGETFRIAYYDKDIDDWIDNGTGERYVEEDLHVIKWMNIELFSAYGFYYDFEE